MGNSLLRKSKGLMVFLFLLLTSMGIFGIDVSAKEEIMEETKRVLYISSYSPSFISFNKQVNGINSILKEDNIVLDIEYMDTKRFAMQENFDHFYHNLSFKVKLLEAYSAIIVADDNALDFIRQHRAELFPTQPIVFLGINNIDKAIEASTEDNMTGVVERISLKETIEVANKLNEDAENVVVLSDTTSSVQGDLKLYRELQGQFPHLDFKEINMGRMSLMSYREALQQLTNKDIVIYLSGYRDQFGKSYTFNDTKDIILANCKQPVYTPYEFGLGSGFMGGKVISHFEQGKNAALIIQRIFNGEDINKIELILESPNKYIFDRNILDKHNHRVTKLPRESILLNDRFQFLKQNAKSILIIVLIILAQGIAIVLLETGKQRRKLIEQELRVSKDEVDQANEKLQSTNEILTATNEELLAALEEISDQDQKIYELVYLDNLTALKNRFAITQSIDHGITYGGKNSKMGILFMDIDNFKNINDSYGHDIGDELIKVTADKLKTFIDDRVHIGRFGGDEFIILIKNTSDEDLRNIAEQIQKCFEDPVVIGSRRFFITLSIGGAIYPEHGKSRRELVKKADMALYKAKALGKNTYEVFCEQMDQQLEKKMLLQNAIKDAIKNKEFHLVYQPYVDAKEHKVHGVEALIRWNSDSVGTVSPLELVMNAEEMGVINEIGEWVLREACLLAKELNDERDEPMTVAVNISALQLMHKEFYHRTLEIIKETGVDPKNICLEMTETVLIESLEMGSALINQLEEKGIKIALDDFGTGYSSLKYFKDLPASVLKIDKSFIDHIRENDYDFYLVELMINIAHMKGKKVIAEGVETEEQLNLLKSINCDFMQGYLLSKPLMKQNLKLFLHWWS